MSKSAITSKLFGLKQKEMALLLGISRAQLSMYESGKRSLPTAAMLVLSEMRAHVETAKATKSQPHAAKAKTQLREVYAKMRKENEFQQLRTTKMIDTIKRKIDADTARSNLGDFLATTATEKGTAENARYLHLLNRGTKVSQTDRFTVLAKLEIKLEVLRFEVQLLQSK